MEVESVDFVQVPISQVSRRQLKLAHEVRTDQMMHFCKNCSKQKMLGTYENRGAGLVRSGPRPHATGPNAKGASLHMVLRPFGLQLGGERC